MSGDRGVEVEWLGEHVSVVNAPGERDAADAEALSQSFDEVFRQGSMLIVDLSETTFIDSGIIGALMEAQAHAHRDQQDDLIVVAPPGRHPRRILDLTVHGILPVVDDLDAALARPQPNGDNANGLRPAVENNDSHSAVRPSGVTARRRPV